MSQHLYKVGEPISAGMFVTPNADRVLFKAKAGDPMVGAMGVLDDVVAGDVVAFEMPRGGLGRKVVFDGIAQ